MTRRPALNVLPSLICIALCFAVPFFSAAELRAQPAEEAPVRTACVEEPATIVTSSDEGTNAQEHLPDWIDLERDSRVPAIQLCEEVSRRTPCDECPASCRFDGDEVPCECFTHSFGSTCLCPA